MSARSSVSNIFDVPDDILVKIMLHLNGTEVMALANSCKKFHNLVFERKDSLWNLDSTEKEMLASVEDIEEYLNSKKTHKQILKVNVRYVNCNEQVTQTLSNSIGKATNLVDIKIHGKKFKSVDELRTFLEPLLRVKKLSVDWPPNKEHDDCVSSVESIPSEVVRKQFNRLTYLSITLWDIPYLKKFLRSLKSCQDLKELHLVVVTDRSGSYDEMSDLIPEELKSLEVVEVSGYKSMAFKRHFVATLPDPEEWIEYELARSFNIQNFHLEKKKPEICVALLEKKIIESMSHVYRWDDSKLGKVLLSERLLKEIIGITHENAPQEFCCLSVPQNRAGCALRIDEAKLLLKNPRHPISFLYLNHNIEPECDVHLVGAAFKNLTEVVLSNIITSEDSIPKESKIADEVAIPESSAPEEQDEESTLRSSFSMFIENTPHVRNVTLDAYTNKLEEIERWDLSALYLIPNWKNLKSLRLLSIPIKDGTFLIEICKQCTQLETFVLYNLGPSDACCCYVDGLSQALSVCRKLKDFAIEANNIGQVSVVFTSIAKNLHLEKIRVMCRGEIFTTVNLIPSIKQLIRRCSKLSTLMCIIDEISRAESDELTSSLQRFKDELNRPAFQFQVGWPKY